MADEADMRGLEIFVENLFDDVHLLHSWINRQLMETRRVFPPEVLIVHEWRPRTGCLVDNKIEAHMLVSYPQPRRSGHAFFNHWKIRWPASWSDACFTVLVTGSVE